MPGSIEGVDGDVMAMCLAQGHIKGAVRATAAVRIICPRQVAASLWLTVLTPAGKSYRRLIWLTQGHFSSYISFPQTYIKCTHAQDTYKCCSASSRTISLFLPTCSPVEDLLSCTGRLLDVNMYNSYTAATRQDMSGKRWYSVNLPGITPGGDK